MRVADLRWAPKIGPQGEAMASCDYDVITVGGGLGGAALAKVLAEKGRRVLVIEREREFKDRIRGEYMMPWGVAEAQKLGLYDLLLKTTNSLPPIISRRLLMTFPPRPRVRPPTCVGNSL